MRELCEKIAIRYGFTAEDLIGRSKNREITYARRKFYQSAFFAGHHPLDIASFVGRGKDAIYEGMKIVRKC